jgi:exoribonuclease R
VKSGIIFRGKLTLSRINMDEAWVKVDQKSALGHDVFISNKTLRNRAINGDIVAVELLGSLLFCFFCFKQYSF